MRFDSMEHLARWKATGVFPAIHDAVFNMAVAEMTGRRVLDLGCSFGLMGARLLGHRLINISVGIDVDMEVIKCAQAAGSPALFNHLKIEPDTFKEIEHLVIAHRLDVIIARRIFPELFGHAIPHGQDFAQIMATAGIKEMIVEGRVNTLSATNPLKSIDQEVEMLSGSFVERRRVGAVSYLVRR